MKSTQQPVEIPEGHPGEMPQFPHAPEEGGVVLADELPDIFSGYLEEGWDRLDRTAIVIPTLQAGFIAPVYG